MVERFHELWDNLRAFVGRYTVIELLVGFALASAVVGLAGAIVAGLVIRRSRSQRTASAASAISISSSGDGSSRHPASLAMGLSFC
jgi:large-conductance mechanosensitive channel